MSVLTGPLASQLDTVEPKDALGCEKADNTYSKELVQPPSCSDESQAIISTPSTDSNFGPTLPELPDEVWHDIFKLALPSGATLSNQMYLGLPSNKEAPMSLAQTCRDWRRIALGSPQLWTTINAVVKRSPDKQMNIYPRVEIIEQWLQLSALCPLSISVVGYQLCGHLAPLVGLLLERLFLEFTRWKSAYLSLPDISFDRVGAYLKPVAEASALERLVLVTECCTPELSAPSTSQEQLDAPAARRFIPTQLWENSSHLQRLVLELCLPDKNTSERSDDPHPNVSGWASTNNIPFHQLTLLQFDGHECETVTPLEVLDILKVSPNLVSCRFLHIKTRELLPESNKPTFDLLHLRDLRLSVCISDYDDQDRLLESEACSLTVILTGFTAPSLVHLALSYDDRIDLNCLGSFLENSSCFLEELELNDSPLTSKDFIKCLRLVPTLKSLRRGMISPKTKPDDILLFNALAVWDAQRSRFDLCPLLEELTVDHRALEPRRSSEFSNTIFADMIKRRLGHGESSSVKPCFKNLKLTRFFGGKTYTEYAALKKLRRPPFNLDLRLSNDSSYPNLRYLSRFGVDLE